MAKALTDEPIDTVELVAEKGIQLARTATFTDLVHKQRRTLTFPVTVGDEENPQTLRVKFAAIGPKEYDRLVAEHPPSPKDKQDGAVFNLDSFAPALISAVSVTPELTVEQAAEIWSNPDWSGGELSSLFINAQRVCNAGLDVPFNARG